MIQRFVSSYLGHMMALTGSTLVTMGLFLPVRFSTITYPSHPLSFADSYWSLLTAIIRTDGVLDLTLDMAIGSFLFAILLPLLSSLAGLFGKRTSTMLLFHLGFVALGVLEFFLFSASLFSEWGVRTTITHSLGPGFWVMLTGFLLSLGSGICQEIGANGVRQAANCSQNRLI